MTDPLGGIPVVAGERGTTGPQSPGASTPRGPTGTPEGLGARARQEEATSPDSAGREANRGNLRGSSGDSPRGGGYAGSSITSLQVDRELRLTVPAVPTNFEEYGNWRFTLEGQIIGCGADPELAVLGLIYCKTQ